MSIVFTIPHPTQHRATSKADIHTTAVRCKKRGGGGRQFISSVLIYRKCAQRNIRLLHGKKRLFGKKYEPIGRERPYRPSPFESATGTTLQTQLEEIRKNVLSSSHNFRFKNAPNQISAGLHPTPQSDAPKLGTIRWGVGKPHSIPPDASLRSLDPIAAAQLK